MHPATAPDAFRRIAIVFDPREKVFRQRVGEPPGAYRQRLRCAAPLRGSADKGADL